LLQREENLKVEQRFRLRDLLRYNLQTVRAYLLKEAFQQLWDYSSPAWAGKFLDEWCRQTMRSRIEPMKKNARSLRQHRGLILNYFPAQELISSGVVEGLGVYTAAQIRRLCRRTGGKQVYCMVAITAGPSGQFSDGFSA
jgi:transposase